MAGTLTVDTIQSDSSYASTLNVASKINFTSGMQIGGQDATFGGMRNRLINGAMIIDQRNAGANTVVGAGAGYITLDRWLVGNGGTITANVASSTDAPVGFTSSLKITITTTGTTSNTMYMFQRIEGYNTADFKWGTSDAATATLSFWVKSSIVGTYAAYIFPDNTLRSYVAPYTINSANTWEKKTITIAGDTSGTWRTDNGQGIQVSFALSGTASSSATSTINQWFTGTYFAYSSGTNLATTNGATFQITGVQFEKGSAASAFEYRQYGQELALCQRYYWQASYPGGSYDVLVWAESTTQGTFYGKYPVTMRLKPTVTLSSAIGLNQNYGGAYVQSSANFNNQGTPSTLVGYASGWTGLTAGKIYEVDYNLGGYMKIDAEI
jgi:hypothetical protein